MYRPKPSTINKVKKLEKQAQKVIKDMESKLGKKSDLKIVDISKITSSAEMSRYIKDLETLIGNSKIKKVKGKNGSGIYVTEEEYKTYTSGFRKSSEKVLKFEDQARKRISKRGQYNAFTHLSSMLEKMRIKNINYIRSREEFIYEMNKLKKVLDKNFYKIEIGQYKKNYLEAARRSLSELVRINRNATVTDIMARIVKRLESMHFRTFYQNYYSGKLYHIDDLYESVKLLRENKNEIAASWLAQEILEGLS